MAERRITHGYDQKRVTAPRVDGKGAFARLRPDTGFGKAAKVGLLATAPVATLALAGCDNPFVSDQPKTATIDGVTYVDLNRDGQFTSDERLGGGNGTSTEAGFPAAGGGANPAPTTEGQPAPGVNTNDYVLQPGESITTDGWVIVKGDVQVDGVPLYDNVAETGLIVEIEGGSHTITAPYGANVMVFGDIEGNVGAEQAFANTMGADVESMKANGCEDGCDVVTVVKVQ